MTLYLLLLIAGLLQSPRDTSYIRPRSEVISPDGKFEVHFVDVMRKSSLNNFLILKDLQTGKEKTIYSSNLNGILWSPDSKCLAGNEYGPGNYADCIILRLHKKVQKITVTNLLTKIPEVKQHFTENQRVFVLAEKWLSNTLLKISIHGYGEFDKNGFNLWYEYDLAKYSFKKISNPKE
jgi:hypothetical protein